MKQDRSRRDLLRACLVAGAGASVFGGLGPLTRLAAAAEPGSGKAEAKVKDRYFLFCYFGGGWDVLLSLDPRDPVLFHEGNVAKHLILPAYDKLKYAPGGGKPVTAYDWKGDPVLLGPYIGGLAKQFAEKRLSIVRGMSMDTLTHEVGRRRFLTGKPPSGLLARGSSGATVLASLLGQDQIVPNLAMRVESYNVDQPNYATGLKVGSVPDLVRALQPGGVPTATGAGQSSQGNGAPAGLVLPNSVLAQVDALLAQDALCDVAQQSAMWSTAEEARLKARQMVQGGLDGLFDFQAKTPAMEKLRNYYGIAPTGPGALTQPPAQAAMAVTALTAGVARCVSVTVAESLDTHFEDWTTLQGPRQMAAFDLVSKMMDDLASRPFPGSNDSWLDHTTIIGFSEFSRTPMLNGFMGRDHHLTNSCFVAGAGIQGGRVLGASSDVAMGPQKVDLKTGALSAKGEIVKPEHLYMALLHDLGVVGDPDDLRVDPLYALLKKG